MAERPEDLEPLDEDEPIPGSPRSRVALAVGMVILVGIVVFLAWFIATNSERGEARGFFG